MAGIDDLPPPDGEAPPGWYEDGLVPNRRRYWDGEEWTVMTKVTNPAPPPTTKALAGRWALALIGLATLALGLAFGFLVAYDSSPPGFRRDAREAALSNAQDRYGVTVTRTETQTVIRTTPVPSP